MWKLNQVTIYSNLIPILWYQLVGMINSSHSNSKPPACCWHSHGTQSPHRLSIVYSKSVFKCQATLTPYPRYSEYISSILNFWPKKYLNLTPVSQRLGLQRSQWGPCSSPKESTALNKDFIAVSVSQRSQLAAHRKLSLTAISPQLSLITTQIQFATEGVRVSIPLISQPPQVDDLQQHSLCLHTVSFFSPHTEKTPALMKLRHCSFPPHFTPCLSLSDSGSSNFSHRLSHNHSRSQKNFSHRSLRSRTRGLDNAPITHTVFQWNPRIRQTRHCSSGIHSTRSQELQSPSVPRISVAAQHRTHTPVRKLANKTQITHGTFNLRSSDIHTSALLFRNSKPQAQAHTVTDTPALMKLWYKKKTAAPIALTALSICLPQPSISETYVQETHEHHSTPLRNFTAPLTLNSQTPPRSLLQYSQFSTPAALTLANCRTHSTPTDSAPRSHQIAYNTHSHKLHNTHNNAHTQEIMQPHFYFFPKEFCTWGRWRRGAATATGAVSPTAPTALV